MTDIAPLLPDDATLRRRRDALVAELRRERVPARRPRRPAVVLAALALCGGGVAAARAILRGEDVNVTAGVGCYHDGDGRGMTIMGARHDPVAACAALWREGHMDGRPRAQAPRLVACTAKGKPVFVMPGDARTCQQHGMQPLPADYAPLAARDERLHAAISRVTEPYSCRPATALAAAVRRSLDDAGFQEIRVVIDPGEGCADAATAGGVVHITSPRP